MKRKRLAKKLVFNKETVSNLCFDSMDEAVGGTLPPSIPESLCPEFTCGEQVCSMTRLYPQAMFC
jgi:hypothetical protein